MSSSSQRALDALRAHGLGQNKKIRAANREKNRRKYTRKLTLGKRAESDSMRLAADWVSFLWERHVVVGRLHNNHTNPFSAAALLQWVNSLTPSEQSKLVELFELEKGYEPGIYFVMYHRDTVGSQLAKETPYIQACMHQIALGWENVVIHSIRFGDEWIEDRIEKRKSDTLTAIINREIKSCLKDAWNTDRLITSDIDIPPWFHVLDFTEYRHPTSRGPGGFHVHGMTVADNLHLQVIKRAFEAASNGYGEVWTNKRVHFGEPSPSYSNRGGEKRNCLSDYPNAVRIPGSGYTFNNAGYISHKKPRAQAAGKALGVDVGSCWGRSKGLKNEAEACLKLFKLLLDRRPGH